MKFKFSKKSDKNNIEKKYSIKKLWQLIGKYKWQTISLLLLLSALGSAYHSVQLEEYVTNKEKDLADKNYIVASTKDNKKITAVNVLNHLKIDNTVRVKLKESIVINYALLTKKDSVPDNEVDAFFENMLIAQNKTKDEFLKAVNTTEKAEKEAIREQIAINNVIKDHTEVTSKEIEAMQKLNRQNIQVLIAEFVNKDDADKCLADLKEKQRAGYKLTKDTVLSMFQQNKKLNNDKYIEQTFDYENTRYNLDVKNQIVLTEKNQFTPILSNGITKQPYQRFYIAYVLNPGDKIKNKNTDTKIATKIAKEKKLESVDELSKSIDDVLTKSNIDYKQPWGDIVG